MQRLVESEAFALAWSLATDEKRKEVEGWIYLGNATLIEKWSEAGKESELEMMSLRQLRQRASSLGIPYYSRLGKSELIWEIEECRKPS